MFTSSRAHLSKLLYIEEKKNGSLKYLLDVTWKWMNTTSAPNKLGGAWKERRQYTHCDDEWYANKSTGVCVVSHSWWNAYLTCHVHKYILWNVKIFHLITIMQCDEYINWRFRSVWSSMQNLKLDTDQLSNHCVSVRFVSFRSFLCSLDYEKKEGSNSYVKFSIYLKFPLCPIFFFSFSKKIKTK